MSQKNRLTYMRTSLAAELLALYFEDIPLTEIDLIPLRRTPKDKISIRCCIYKDRAMYRYRLMALMGIDVETEDDDFRTLASYAEEALTRQSPSPKVLTIIDIACSSCQQNAYMVTNMCKGCSARPCEVNCPKKAIEIVHTKSIINQEMCVSCGKCLDACPYNAIIHTPVPCEKGCPVGAISRNQDTGKEEIDYDKCIYCGRCTRACPFGTIMDRSQMFDVAKHLKAKKNPVVAMIAPAIIGQFKASIGQVIAGLKELGFDFVYEVAYGADITARNEAEELIEKLAEGVPILGTSCCPAYVESVKKHVKSFEKFISHTRTPMSYTAEVARNDHPDATTVFIGPCIAKKFEGTNDEFVDYVLTYSGLDSLFQAKQIDLSLLPDEKYDSGDTTVEAKRFCIDGGVTETVKYYINKIDPTIEVKALIINGLDKKGLKKLASAAKGKLPYNIVECMSCAGGCIAGPSVLVNPAMSRRKLPALEIDN